MRSVSLFVMSLAIFSSCGRYFSAKKSDQGNADKGRSTDMILSDFDLMAQTVSIGAKCRLVSSVALKDAEPESQGLKIYHLEKSSSENRKVLSQFAISNDSNFGLARDDRSQKGYWKFSWSRSEVGEQSSLTARSITWDVNEVTKETVEFSLVQEDSTKLVLEDCQ
ncbi:MAG: hypothetical protein NTV34_18105 [Proteobacteria bacterium]|nr:hypothetical protein [Pseudomonadota bacterium]